MTYKNHLIRQTKIGWEATHKDDGWECDWEWLLCRSSLDSLKKAIDTRSKSV